MKYKLAVLFTQAPFGTAVSREGLNALLAASAFCNEDEIAILFLHDGVFNLVANQQPEVILQKDHIAAFKLLELYELSECFVCGESVCERGLTEATWVLADPNIISRAEIFYKLHQAEKVLTF